MLIYHITDERVQCAQVILGAGTFYVSHEYSIHENHLCAVNQLRNNGKVFVTGDTYDGTVYEGTFEDRSKYQKYLDK